MGFLKKLFSRKQDFAISPLVDEKGILTTTTTKLDKKEPLIGANVLLDANQFLRYKAESKKKMEAQVALTDALLSHKDAPAVRLVVFRCADSMNEYPWLVLKAGTAHALHTYGSSFFDETFAKMFGDQPYSIIWADHIAENCPRPGEFVTENGQRVYAGLAQDIKTGKYIIDRVVRE